MAKTWQEIQRITLSFINKTQFGNFTNTLGPARFDGAGDLLKDFLLLASELIPEPMYRDSNTDHLALVMRELDDKETQNDGIFADKNGVKRFRRIGIVNVNNHKFFHNIPFTQLILE
jgi:hypothetical protein